jgi:hypothetical protein
VKETSSSSSFPSARKEKQNGKKRKRKKSYFTRKLPLRSLTEKRDLLLGEKSSGLSRHRNPIRESNLTSLYTTGKDRDGDRLKERRDMKRDDEEEKQNKFEEIHKQLDFVDSQHLHDPNLVTPPNRVWSTNRLRLE